MITDGGGVNRLQLAGNLGLRKSRQGGFCLISTRKKPAGSNVFGLEQKCANQGNANASTLAVFF